MKAWSFRPIGVIRTPHTRTEDTPRQPSYADGATGRVELLPEFEEGLEGLERYSHVYLLFVFDRANEARLRVTPPGEETPRGVFATRSPSRPTAIGMSLVRLVRREGTTLHVEDVDMLDGTPLLDIKPYIGDLDSRT